jgi:hypothetical protein
MDVLAPVPLRRDTMLAAKLNKFRFIRRGWMESGREQFLNPLICHAAVLRRIRGMLRSRIPGVPNKAARAEKQATRHSAYDETVARANHVPEILLRPNIGGCSVFIE